MPSLPPAGFTPAAAYTIPVYPPQLPPPAILADRIDPLTGDYASLLRGHALADGFAIEALRVRRGTGAAVRDLGNRLRAITHIEAGATEQAESMLREAFAAGEQAGVVRLERVTVTVDETDGAQLNAFAEYRDLLAPPTAPTRRLVFPP